MQLHRYCTEVLRDYMFNCMLITLCQHTCTALDEECLCASHKQVLQLIELVGEKIND